MKIQNKSSEERNEFLVSFSQEELSEEEQKALVKLRDSSKIGNHEKGQAPLELISKLFKNQIASSAGEVLLARALGLVSKDQPVNIKPELHTDYRSSPSKKYNGVRNDAGDLEFLVTWKNPEQVPITNLVCEVDVEYEDRGKMIENQLEILKLQSGALISVDRPAIETDYVTCRIEIYSADESELIGAYPSQTINNRLKESFFGEKVAEAVLGAKKGDNISVKKYYSPNFRYAPLRDKDTVIKIEVNDVFENVIPELNDEFAQKIGHDSMELLRAEIGKKWDAVANSRREKAVKAQLLDVLIANNPFEMDQKRFNENLKSEQESMVESMGLEISFEALLEKLPDQSDRDKLIESAKKAAETNTRWAQLMLAVMQKFPKETTLSREDCLRYAAGNGKSGNTPESELAVIEGSNYYHTWLRNKRYTKAYEYIKSLAIVKDIEPTQVVDFTRDAESSNEV